MARPRRSGPRTPSGRLSRAYAGPARDAGTAELAAKKLALVNGARDPALSASAASILFAHRVLDRDQLAAAVRYGALHSIVFGQAWAGACILGREPGTEAPFDDDGLERRERELNRMAAQLTPEQKIQLDNLVISGWLPSWFFVAQGIGRELAQDARDRQDLLSGLDALLGRRGGAPGR